MKTKNTYSLLINSEEKGRSIFESAIYGLVVVCMAFTGWQFASSSVALPRMPAATAQSTDSQPVVVASNN